MQRPATNENPNRQHQNTCSKLPLRDKEESLFLTTYTTLNDCHDPNSNHRRQNQVSDERARAPKESIHFETESRRSRHAQLHLWHTQPHTPFESNKRRGFVEKITGPCFSFSFFFQSGRKYGDQETMKNIGHSNGEGNSVYY
jgi:hypothetical protein